MAKKTTTETPAAGGPKRAKARYWEPEEGEPMRVRWVGPGDPGEGNVSMGNLTIELPDAASQRAGFATPHARFLVGAVAGYKYAPEREE
jgi:hypothetical protein